MLIPSRNAKSAEILYDIMCRYLINAGWRRETSVSGWWCDEDGNEDMQIGDAVRNQLHIDGIDIREMRVWEPHEFWGDE